MNIFRVLSTALVCLVVGMGCGKATGSGSQTNWFDCRTDDECHAGERCVRSRCEARDGGVTASDAGDAADSAVSTPPEGPVVSSCVDKLDGYYGQCLALESDCDGAVASLRVVRTALCKSPARLELSCTDPGGQPITRSADVPAFGGTLPEIAGCACVPKSRTALDATLRAGSPDQYESTAHIGCRTDGVALGGSFAWGGGKKRSDAGIEEHPYGGPVGSSDPTEPCGEFIGDGLGACVTFSSCWNLCTSVDDCPDPGSGSAVLDCVATPGSLGLVTGCVLRCDGDHTCPRGMTCTHEFALGDICLWSARTSRSECP